MLRPDDKKRILVNGSIAESSGLLPRFYHRGKLPFVAFVDADSAGRRLITALESWEIPKERILDLRPLFNIQGDFEIEDVLTIPFYHGAVEAAYPEQPVDPPPEGQTGKRTKYYELKFKEVHAIGFNKRRVAAAAKRLLQDGRCDDLTRENLKKLVDAIWATLQAQLGSSAAAVGQGAGL